jgi:lipopolysaccharide transport system ATP-binding protein
MSQPILTVEKLSKSYRLEAQRAGERVLASQLVGALRRVITRRNTQKLIWALRDVSFEVEPGQAVGIVGANGAGKSTLLKIIGRLTLPTSGRVSVRGRIGSMLDFGVGFHPELTGRENVFLSGVILGMGRAEIRAKFDEIVNFSGIEHFLDEPVKHYSSGMRMRLAFSVMVTLEPEILLLDEIMGVGDESFRQRSTERMKTLIQSGRTVLFVSHNQRAVADLCDWTMQLEKGRIDRMGSTTQVVQEYIEQQVSRAREQPIAKGHAELEPKPYQAMVLRAVSIVDDSDTVTDVVELSRPFRVRIRYDVNVAVSNAHVFCRIETADGLTVIGSGDADCDPRRLAERPAGTYTADFEVPGGLLEASLYRITIGMGEPFKRSMERREGVVYFTLIDESSTRQTWYQQTRPGLIGQEYLWRYHGHVPWAQKPGTGKPPV